MHMFQLGCTTLNGTSQDLRSQLLREQDTARQSTLQKDLEVREMRLRFDRLVRVSICLYEILIFDGSRSLKIFLKVENL